jgi:hypothetical protein
LIIANFCSRDCLEYSPSELPNDIGGTTDSIENKLRLDDLRSSLRPDCLLAKVSEG